MCVPETTWKKKITFDIEPKGLKFYEPKLKKATDWPEVPVIYEKEGRSFSLVTHEEFTKSWFNYFALCAPNEHFEMHIVPIPGGLTGKEK